MSDTATFLNLVRGSRLKNYMGLVRIDETLPYKFGPGYNYVEISAIGFTSGDPNELLFSVKRNQRVLVVPACSIKPMGEGTIVEVEPCIDLSEFGQVQAPYKVHTKSGKMIPGFWFTPHRDTSVSDIMYAIRLYLYS